MTRSGTVARGTLARFTAEAAGAGFGLIVGSVTARNLGPEGKGTLSALTFLVALAAPLCAVGLGEATLALVGRGTVDLQRAASSVLTALLLTTAAGMALLLALMPSLFPGELSGLHAAIPLSVMTLPVITAVTVLGMVVESAQQHGSARQVVFVSGVRTVVAALTAVLTIVFVLVLDRAITGAILAVLVAWSSGALALLLRLHRVGIRPLPGWDWRYMRAAVRLGVPTQLSYFVIVASARVDLLFVRRLAGREAAGQYSVALTVGQLAAYAPVALAVAAFPTITRLDADEARLITARLCRTAVATAGASALVLAITTPFLIPLAFGGDFRPAVGPTIILLGGGVLWGAQWVACRAEAARGRPGVLLWSFGGGLVTMIVADLTLIPPLSSYGAATASALAAGVGLAIVIAIRDESSVVPRLRGFLPHRDDVRHIAAAMPTRPGQFWRPVYRPRQPGAHAAGDDSRGQQNESVGAGDGSEGKRPTSGSPPSPP